MTDSPWWTACEHPERPPDNYQTFHVQGCLPCRLAAVATGKWLEQPWELAERRRAQDDPHNATEAGER